MKRLKKLHKSVRENQTETPFGNFASLPSAEEKENLIAAWKEEFPEYQNFDFECSLECEKDGVCVYQWYLIGERMRE